MPVYERVKAYVTSGISRGAWKVGERLPSEHELAATLGVSRLTVHRAFRELAGNGVLSRVHGVGTFIAPPKPISAIVRLHNIADEIRERGDRLSIKVQRLARVQAGAEIAARFDIAPRDPLFHSVIIYSANDVPLQLEHRYVSPAFAPDFLKQDFAVRSTTDYLQAIAMPTEASLMIEAQMPDPETSRLLRMGRNEPCLVVTRQTWVDRLVTTFTRFHHPGSRHRISSRFDSRARPQ